jgi:thymidylate synthase
LQSLIYKNINMSRVDKIFQDNLALIMSQPLEEVKRPVYGDGTGVKVKRILQVCNQYDLRREFPLGSLRPTNLKNSIKEILWIWQKRSVDVKELGLHIWDQWADKNGKIEGCYGDMINTPVILDDAKNDTYIINQNGYFINGNEIVGRAYEGYGFENQTDFILWSLKNDKSSRRIIASMFNPVTNSVKPLQECAFQINLSVKGDELYMTLYQRSQDAIVAGLWNVAQYAALMMMFAHDAGLKPAVFTHFIQDMHVYDRHEEQANELLRRSLFGPVPQVTISSRMEGKGFYDFTPDDFEVWNYEPKEQIKFEVAK